MLHRFRQTILLLLLGTLFAQCAPNEQEALSERRFGPSSYDVGDCRFQPTSGADYRSPTPTPPPTTLNYFRKSIVVEKLEAALSASALSVAKALFNEGVDLFQVLQTPELSCRYFDFLAPAPEKPREGWNVANTGSGSTLLGLFTATYSQSPSTQITHLLRPTILLLDRTQKWTLLHEMSHYLFASQRVQKIGLPFNSDLEKQVRDLRINIERLKQSIKTDPIENQGLHLVNLYQQFFEANFELDKRTALEEFTVEAMLIRYGRDNRVSDVDSEKEMQHGFLYMRSNGERVLFSYVLFLDQLREAQAWFDQQRWKDAQQQMGRLIQQVTTEVEFIQSELDFARPERTLEDVVEPTPHYNLEQFQKRHQRLRDWTGF